MTFELDIPGSSDNWTPSDADLFNFVGNDVSLKIQDNPSQTFNEDFADDTDFTYDNTKSEFSAGKLQQIDQAPTNSTCWATYTNNINLNVSPNGGVLAGSAVGGAAVSGGKLDLAHSDTRYVDYDADLNADSQQTGTIKFKITPNYSGNPANDQYLFAITKQNASHINELSFYHKTTGTLSIRIYSSSGVLAGESTFIAWAPTSGIEYEFEVTYDLTTGANRFFINGIQQGATSTVTTTRDANIELMRVGSSYNASTASNFKIEDLIIFSTVQHTANYTPGYTLEEVRFVEDLITYPVFTYPGVGAVQAFTNIVATQTGVNKFNVNGRYYSGGWVSSDDTYAQMNTIAEILTNIATLPSADTVTIKMRTLDTDTQMDIDDLTLTYTGQIYPTSNPYLTANSAIRHEGLEGYVVTETVVGSDLLKHLLSKGDPYYYHSGSWVVSDETYAQTNTEAEIETNKATFTTIAVETTIRVYFHSEDGSTTPTLSNVRFLYDFSGNTPDNLTTCIVWGYVKVADGEISTDIVSVYPSEEMVEYKNYTQILYDKLTVTPNSIGYWELELLIPNDMTPVPYHVFKIGDRIFKKVIPNQTTVNFNDLVDYSS